LSESGDASSGAADTAVLEVRNATKSYRGFLAIDDVSISLHDGEVLGLIGENGAGKSTLLNVICGAISADEGEMTVRGEPYAPRSYHDAMSHGVFRVYQEPALVPVLTVRENLVLGVEQQFSRWGMLKRRTIRRAAAEVLRPLGDLVSADQLVATCDRNTRQTIELLRAVFASRVLGIERPIILLDEPTAALMGSELTILFETLARLRGEASFVFVTHRLAEIHEHCDRAYVMKDGAIAAEVPAKASEAELHRLMVGRVRADDYYAQEAQTPAGDDVVLQVDGLCGDGFNDVGFTLHAGEILGVAGVVGSGKESLGRVLAGIARPKAGSIEHAAGSQRREGAIVGYVPSDRINEGVVEIFSVAGNISLSSLAYPPIRRGFFISRAQEKAVAAKWIANLGVRTRSGSAQMNQLSGGNQQKVVLGRVLQTGARVVVLDNPTRGVDAGSKAEIYVLVRGLVANGLGVVFIADELPEVIGLSSRILVMKDGTPVSEMNAQPGGKPEEEILIADMV
jgi:ribose transport system ATP-binding protein